MGASWEASEQQWAAITAPLAPAVVIAGAGSGKTTLMAARVVYLVLTGQVRPDQVLGLTFTTKAASQLRAQIRQALTDAGALDDSAREDEDVLEPTVSTYNAYAAGLLTDHGLRIGHRAGHPGHHRRCALPLGARVVDRHTGVVAHLSDHPKTVIQNLLDLDGRWRAPGRGRRRAAGRRRGAGPVLAAAEEERQGKNRSTYVGVMEKAARHRASRRVARPGRRLPADEGRPRVDGLLRPDRSARCPARRRPARGRRSRAGEVQGRAPRRVPGHVRRAGAVVLSRLFLGADAASGRGHAVTAVGDPNQAIYGWRGASVSNILGFAETFPAASGSVPSYPLTVNRRFRPPDPRGRQPPGRAALRRVRRGAGRSRRSRGPTRRRDHPRVRDPGRDEAAPGSPRP